MTSPPTEEMLRKRVDKKCLIEFCHCTWKIVSIYRVSSAFSLYFREGELSHSVIGSGGGLAYTGTMKVKSNENALLEQCVEMS